MVADHVGGPLLALAATLRMLRDRITSEADQFELNAFAARAEALGTAARDLLAQAMAAVKGDIGNKKDVIKAMEGATIDSPRGKWTMSRAHNPIQDIYLREVVGEQNKYVGVAMKQLADPARGCKM